MKTKTLFIIWFMMSCILSWAQNQQIAVPPEQVFVYQMSNGKRSQYLAQAPTNIPSNAAIVICFHGYMKNEKQGMTLFPLLREWIAKKGWIYISPTDYEIGGLLKDITARYGNRPIFLAGASAGCGAVFDYARSHPKRISGLFLIGPAFCISTLKSGEIVIPTFLVFGDQDAGNTSSAHAVIDALTEQGVPLKYEEIKGGDHNAPYGNQSWWSNALEFVTDKAFEKEKQ